MRESGSVRPADQLVNAEHLDAAHPVGHHLDVAADVDPAAAGLVLGAPVHPLGGRAFLQPVGGPSYGVSVSTACWHARRGDEVDDGDMAELLPAGPGPGRVAGVVYQVVRAGDPPDCQVRRRQRRLACGNAAVRMQLTVSALDDNRPPKQKSPVCQLCASAVGEENSAAHRRWPAAALGNALAQYLPDAVPFQGGGVRADYAAPRDPAPRPGTGNHLHPKTLC